MGRSRNVPGLQRKASPIPMFASKVGWGLPIDIIQYIDYLLGMRIQECFKHDVTSI